MIASFNVSEESRFGLPIRWEVKDSNGEVLGTVYDNGPANAVEVNFIKPFPIQLWGGSIKIPTDYTKPFQSTKLKIETSTAGGILIIESAWHVICIH